MAIDIAEIRRIVHESLEVPTDFEYDYDEEADVLYVTFDRAIEDDATLTPNNLILRYCEGRLIGVTILNASKRPNLHLP